MNRYVKFSMKYEWSHFEINILLQKKNNCEKEIVMELGCYIQHSKLVMVYSMNSMRKNML